MKFKTKDGHIYKVNDTCIDGITFKELAEKAKSNSSAYGGHFCTMFGKTITEIADLILKNEEDNIKMTREEAEKLVSKLAYNVNNDKLFCGVGLPPEKEFINVLEALGLIKFDESKIDPIHEIIYNTRVLSRDTNKHDQSDFINRLARHGYKIVKNA